MSLVESPVRESPAEIRRRLFRPAGGRSSSELDILAPPIARRQRMDQLRQEAAEAAALAQEEREQRIKEIIEDARILSRRPRKDEEQAPRPPKLGTIIAEICERFRVTEIDLLSKRRDAGIVLPRQIAMYLCKTMTFKSLPEIGRRLGGKDHTTVLHGVRKIARLVESYPHLAAEIKDIKKSLGGE